MKKSPIRSHHLCRSEIPAILAFLTGLALGLPSVSASTASDSPLPTSRPLQCGILQTFGGDVQILDPSRTRILDLFTKTQIPCGSWISIQNGWIEIRHHLGFSIQGGSATFFQLLPYHETLSQEKPDHLTLFRGSLFIHAGEGTGEVRLVTPNARTASSLGSTLTIYQPSEESTQLIALGQPAWIENRFESATRQTLQPGESSGLDLKSLRVSPSTPQSIQLTEVRARLYDVRVDEDIIDELIHRMKLRTERLFAATLVKPVPKNQRAPASEPSAENREPAGLTRYERHPTPSQDSGIDQKLNQHFTRRIAGGQKTALDLLYPDSPSLTAREQAEKKKLLQQLKNQSPDFHSLDSLDSLDSMKEPTP